MRQQSRGRGRAPRKLRGEGPEHLKQTINLAISQLSTARDRALQVENAGPQQYDIGEHSEDDWNDVDENQSSDQPQEVWWKGQRWTAGGEGGILWQGQIWSEAQAGQYCGDQSTAKALADARAEEQIAASFGYKAVDGANVGQGSEDKAMHTEAQGTIGVKDKGGNAEGGQEPSKRPRMEAGKEQQEDGSGSRDQGDEQR